MTEVALVKRNCCLISHFLWPFAIFLITGKVINIKPFIFNETLFKVGKYICHMVLQHITKYKNIRMALIDT